MIAAALTALLMLSPPTLSVRVDGEGYLRFSREGRAVYAKAAKLSVSAGKLVGPEGVATLPPITVGEGVESISIDLEGNVSVRRAGSTATAGRLVLALFEGALVSNGSFLSSADRPKLGNPGEGLNGVIRTEGGAPTQAAPQKEIKTGGVKPVATNTPDVKPPVAGLAENEILVSVSSEITGTAIKLGDIASFGSKDSNLRAQLSAIELGDAPVIGIPRPIVASRIMFGLSQAGLDPKKFKISVPTGAKVSRASAKVTGSDFAEAAKKAALLELGTEVPLEATNVPTDLTIPMGELELRTQKPQKNGTSLVVLVEAYVDGKKVNGRLVTLRVDASAGIRAGDTVKIVLRSGGAVIETAGRAKTAGFLGQQVTVVTDTGSTHVGTVLSSSKVEVKL